MKSEQSDMKTEVSRRDFIKKSAVAAVSLSALTAGTRSVAHAAGTSELLKVGLVGCGGRGLGAVTQFLLSTKTPVKLWAMGDIFRDNLNKCYGTLSKGAKARYDRKKFGSLSARMSVPESRKFVGFDAYKNVIDSGVDVVILATPPFFRPEHLMYTVKANKHVFIEKPAGVDPVGIRKLIEASELAETKGLSIVAGTQRRHQNHYIDIMNRVHNGEIGEIVSGQCFWNIGECFPLLNRKPEWSDMEWQCRNWGFYTWLSGDHICEQHVHNIDIINWAIRAHPVHIMGMGGRAYRKGPKYGNVFDHFAVEFEYPDGVRVASYCRQSPGCTGRVSERVLGTKGWAYTDSANGILQVKGKSKYQSPASPNPYYQEHADLINSIRQGRPINEGRQVAESTLCAIIGRMSAYTGRAMKWDWVIKKSKLDLSPPKYEFGDLPERPVAIPGKTKLM